MKEERTNMKKWVIFAAALTLTGALAAAAAAATARKADVAITGAGSTFVSPLVQTWTQPVGQALGISLSYNPIGSGGGIAAISNRTVDFGASDAPLTADQFAACKGCLQIPWALSATAVLYNLPNAKNLIHMTGPTLAKIFSGQITKWNDPAIAALNKGVTLPGTTITTVHRSDGSGTTWNFSDYLSSVSPDWKSKYGVGTSVNWPNGTGGRGSAGVAAIVSQTEGSIGYADVAFALKNHLKYFAMQNSSGKFTTPGLRGILSAASSDQKPDANNALSIVNPPKKFANAYPISTFTYVIVPEVSPKAADLRRFLFWAVTKGQSYGPKLLFQPIPKPALVVAEKTLKKIHNNT
jgi:phosphate transport system substrate-binding protein